MCFGPVTLKLAFLYLRKYIWLHFPSEADCFWTFPSERCAAAPSPSRKFPELPAYPFARHMCLSIIWGPLKVRLPHSSLSLRPEPEEAN